MRAWKASIAVAAGVLVLGLAGTAHASQYDLPNGRGNGGFQDGTGLVYACDTKPDNWGVRTHYTTSNGIKDTVGDADGSKGGCGRKPLKGGGYLTALSVCAGVNGADTTCVP